MRWVKATETHICSNCDALIDIGDIHLIISSADFCKPCGKKYKNGELRYSKKDKRYKALTTSRTCEFCSNPSEYHKLSTGQVVCEEHLGMVLNEEK